MGEPATPATPQGARPYPVVVTPRDPRGEPPRPDGGLETFEAPAADEINRARMAHLASLDLPLAGKRVLDVGCGVGHLAQFFVERGCRVTCVDARPANVEALRARYPGLEAHVVNLEVEPLSRLGRFDVVFCYGLLYHLENPLAALRNMEAVCDQLLLLETIVCDHAEPVIVLADETLAQNQALAGLGNRPSPSYVTMALNRVGFRFVYAPREPPDHPEFRFTWQNDLAVSREGQNLRCIFVAARREVPNPSLVPLLGE